MIKPKILITYTVKSGPQVYRNSDYADNVMTVQLECFVTCLIDEVLLPFEHTQGPISSESEGLLYLATVDTT